MQAAGLPPGLFVKAATWNLRGKTLTTLGDWLENNDDFDVVALQELGGHPEFTDDDAYKDGTLKEVRILEHRELDDYILLVAPSLCLDSHLSQGILLDRASATRGWGSYSTQIGTTSMVLFSAFPA